MSLELMVTIRLKILVGCLGLTLMTAMLGLYERSVEKQLGMLGVRLYDDAFQAMSYLRAAQNDLLVAASLPDDQAATRLQDAQNNLAVAEDRAMSPGGHRASSLLRAQLRRLAEQDGAERNIGFTAAQQAFDDAVEIYSADAYHFRRVVGDVLVATDQRTWTLIGFSLLIALLIILSLSRSILPQLREAVGIAQAIAAGRLDNTIQPRGRSETALLLRALASMQEAIARSLAENRAMLLQQQDEHAAQARHQAEIDAVVQNFGSSMAGVFQLVSSASVGMAQTAGGLLSDTEALFASERHVQAQIAQVVQRIDVASHSSQALSEAIVEIRAEAAQTEERARATLRETQGATSSMHSLGLAADEIASVVDIIRGLAAQTKLLALNASIEAARAGPSGAGFAVIASEVKRLAERSAKAAQGVGERITSILDAASATRASIAEIAISTEHVHRLSASIAEAVALQQTASGAMGTSVSEILRNATAVQASLDVSGALTRAGAANLRDIAHEATTLSGNAADLSREVLAFLEFVRSLEPGPLSWPEPLRAAATLVLDAASYDGEAVFASELDLTFAPAIAADLGATGVLQLAATGHTIPVRVAQTGRGVTQLQPPLGDADRAHLRAALATLPLPTMTSVPADVALQAA